MSNTNWAIYNYGKRVEILDVEGVRTLLLFCKMKIELHIDLRGQCATHLHLAKSNHL